MNDQLATEVRDALKRLPTDYLLRGMEAFSHPPRCFYDVIGDDSCGCFVTACVGDRSAFRPWEILADVLEAKYREQVLSYAYENCTADLCAECIRELAERGVVPEPGFVLHETRREE